jgi:glycosyltransferase involved in cell wall biosynthesis
MLVDPQDERQLAQIVADLLQEPDRRAKMGRSAKRWVRENFTMDKIAQRYIDFYETVLNFHRSSKFKLEKALVN